MPRSIFKSNIQRILLYTRRKGDGFIYKSGSSVIKTSFIVNPNYKNEYNILTELNHPHIIKFKDAYYEPNRFNIKFPYYPNGDLREGKTLNKKLNKNEILDTTMKLVKPIVYAHKRGIIHLDIKLENYLEDDKNNFILIDFEFAKKFNKAYYDTSELQHIVGTPSYIAPEIKDLVYGPTSDIYSLGKMIYLIITRRFPDTLDIDWRPITFYVPELENILVSMLQNNYKYRPTIYEVHAELEDIIMNLK